MKVISEIGLREFNAWSGAADTQKTIIENNKEDEFDRLIDELYPDGLSDTQLNDILWFESDWCLENVGISEDEDEDEDEHEDEDEL